MKKRLSAFLLALTVLLTLAACSSESSSEAPIRERPSVPNTAGEPAANDRLTETGGTAHAREESLVTAAVDPSDIPGYITIAGMNISTSETELTLMNMDLTDEDIIPLRYMVNLTHLDLDGNNIIDISPLAGLVNLEMLFLQRNRVRDISPLAGLTRLEFLLLWDNVITDISPLTGLIRLEYLNLDENLISDIAPLARLNYLHYLYLWDNDITDISVLANLTNLIFLDLDENYITDLSPLFGLTKLEWLGIAKNRALTDAQINELRAALPDCEIDDEWYW
jgi:Leucine-rich repeat (LRR) protein